jgi:hypothetical protein
MRLHRAMVPDIPFWKPDRLWDHAVGEKEKLPVGEQRKTF